MVASARVRQMIDDKELTKSLPDAIQQGYESYGMQTFDQSLMGLLKQKLITFEEALRQCSNPDDFKLKISGVSSTSDLSWDAFDGTDEQGEK
jgi:twitching motility protein PilT